MIASSLIVTWVLVDKMSLVHYQWHVLILLARVWTLVTHISSSLSNTTPSRMDTVLRTTVYRDCRLEQTKDFIDGISVSQHGRRVVLRRFGGLTG